MTAEETRLFEKASLQVVQIWAELKELLGTLGPITYETKKTSIHCIKETAFLGIHPKKQWLDVNIVLDRSLTGLVDCKVEQVSRNRYHNEVRLKEKEDIMKVVEYVKESFAKGK